MPLGAERIRSLAGRIDLPRGAEVLVSAITIPDMIRIIEHHGLVPVPVDLDPQRMSPGEEQWRQAITPATKMILVAPPVRRPHGNGRRSWNWPGGTSLLVVEDCAQAFAGIAI